MYMCYCKVSVHVRTGLNCFVLLQTQCSYGDTDGLEFALDGRMYELDYQLVDGDVDLPEYALSGNDMTSQGDQ